MGEHVPQRVVHSTRCDMNDTLLGADPVWDARQLSQLHHSTESDLSNSKHPPSQLWIRRQPIPTFTHTLEKILRITTDELVCDHCNRLTDLSMT